MFEVEVEVDVVTAAGREDEKAGRAMWTCLGEFIRQERIKRNGRSAMLSILPIQSIHNMQAIPRTSISAVSTHLDDIKFNPVFSHSISHLVFVCFALRRRDDMGF